MRATFFLTAFCVLSWVGSAIQPDTAHLAQASKNQREKKTLLAAEYKVLQAEYLDWIDGRLRAGDTPPAMNQNLNAAGLLGQGPQKVEEYSNNYTGQFGEIRPESAHDPEILALRTSIYTGIGCSEDQTVLLYNRSPLRRMALINGTDSFSGLPRYLSGIAVGSRNSSGQHTVATGWFTSNCTSIWTGAILRIDLVDGNSKKTILEREVGARREDDSDTIRPTIAGSEVTFRYRRQMSDAELLATPQIERYRVEGMRPVRVPPIALTRGGFLTEWLDMDDSNASNWGTQVAQTKHASIAAEFKTQPLVWNHVSKCRDGVWEIGVRVGYSGRVVNFLMQASHASIMRMIAVDSQSSPSCTKIDISKDLSVVAAELPW